MSCQYHEILVSMDFAPNTWIFYECLLWDLYIILIAGKMKESSTSNGVKP